LRILIKIGGTLLEDEATQQSLARQIGAAAGLNHQIVVVHGGGKQITRFLEKRGAASTFVDGLRVTTPEVLDAVVQVVGGAVNTRLVAALARCGVLSVGLSGMDAGVVQAEQMSPNLGSVGRVTGSNPALPRVLLKHGYVPVVACIGGDAQGNLYNINGDQMAVACARSLGADLLLFLTDVKGVMDREGRVLTRLTPGECGELISSGVARGGMQAKLEAAVAALEGGVPVVRIVPGAAESIILKSVAGEAAGTGIAYASTLAGEAR
jgi:acetylglutamate kinase